MQKLFIPDIPRYECGNCHTDVSCVRISYAELPLMDKVIYKFDPSICPKCKSKFVDCQQPIIINRFTRKVIIECEQMKEK